MNKKLILKNNEVRNRAKLLIDSIPPHPEAPLHIVEIREYKKEEARTVSQNSLSFAIYKDIASQKEDMSINDVRAYCKLHHGIGILKSGTSKLCKQFAEQYDEIIKPLPYETKLKMMVEPIDFPVTSLMGKRQFTQYVDEVVRDFAEQGIIIKLDDIYEGK